MSHKLDDIHWAQISWGALKQDVDTNVEALTKQTSTAQPQPLEFRFRKKLI